MRQTGRRAAAWLACTAAVTALAFAASCSTDNSAAATSKTGATEAPSGAIEKGKYVVVPSSAEFSSGTDATSERWSYPAGHYWSFRVAAVESGWLKLERPEPDRHCYGIPRTLESIELDFWVRPDAVAAVTTRAVSKSWDDGTSVELTPGVVLEETDGKKRKARLEEVGIPVSVDAASVGRAYAKPPRSSTETPPGEWYRAGGGIVIGGERFERSGDAPLRVVEKKLVEERVLQAKIASRCATIGALLQAPVGAEPPAARSEKLDAPFQLSYAAPGSTLYWPGGEPAGRVGDSKWPLRVETRKKGNRPCFAASFTDVAPDAYSPKRHFRVCVDPSSLETPEEVERKKAATRVDQGGGGHVSVLKTTIDIRLRSLEGGHDWDEIKRPVASVQNDIEQCYRREVSPENKFGGTLSIDVRIHADGEIAGIDRTDSTLGNDTVASCVEQMLGRASFPSGSRASTLGVQFVFSLQED